MAIGAFLAGAVLFIAGLGAAVSECRAPAADVDAIVSALAGLALAIGFTLMALSAGSGGYHRRSPGRPPGDMKTEEPD